MKKSACALITESEALAEQIDCALELEATRLKGLGTEPGLVFDVYVFAGRQPAFWQAQRSAIEGLQAKGAWLICAFERRPDWLGRTCACDGVELPSTDDAHGWALFRKALLVRLKVGYGGRGQGVHPSPQPLLSRRLVGIGASTGGPGVLLSVLRALPKETCAILVVQHLTYGFSARFAAYLGSYCAMHVKVAEHAERIVEGTVYLAPDGRHMTVERRPEGYAVRLVAGAKVNGVCPAADCLLFSLASQAGVSAMGFVLTGMGSDGAAGLLALRRAGGAGYAQDVFSSPLPSMPCEAVRYGGAQGCLTPQQMAEEIRRFSRAE